jgi:hypothetical protein
MFSKAAHFDVNFILAYSRPVVVSHDENIYSQQSY